MTTLVDKLLSAAEKEWAGRWGGPSEDVEGRLTGFPDSGKMEQLEPYWKYVGEYWGSIGSTLNGRDKPAWSAAFISFCFKAANAGKKFPYSDNHSAYVAKIDGGAFAGLSLADPAQTSLSKGDLIWASRTGKDCRRPPFTFADAKRELANIRSGDADTFCSHCDIVIAVRSFEVDVIGGNVKDAVTRTTYRLDTNGRLRDGRRNFIGVIKNGL